MLNRMHDLLKNDAIRVVENVDLTPLNNKSILITGATGIIGVNLVASLGALCTLGIGPSKVICAAHSPMTSLVDTVFDFPEATVVSGDLSKGIDFLRNHGPFDYIIHAAGYGQPGKFMADPVKTLQLNTSCTLALFDILNSQGSFLFISTSEVYSGLVKSPFKETQIGSTNTDHPRGCYIEAKRCGEAICNAQSTRGFAARSARVALAYGPGTKKNDHRVLNQFIQRALKDGAIRLQDLGEAKRTYCYVSDTVEILWNIMLYGEKSIYNVGGESRTTIGELAKLIGKITDVNVEFPEAEKDMSDAPEDVSLDMALVSDEFGKSCYVDLNDGLRATVSYQGILYNNYSEG